MVGNIMIKKCYSLLCISFLALIFTESPAFSKEMKTPVLLTFDVEMEEDAVALRKLRLDVPATYFITGQFAEQNQELVRELSHNNTIGLHSFSHVKLIDLESSALRKELLMGKLILEQISGSKITWFRAPYLEYNHSVMSMLKEMGFLYDSSDRERWQRQEVLKELPISDSSGESIMAGDYNLFLQSKMTSEEGLDWLKKLYIQKAETGHPLVILLHPHIIIKYSDTLRQFITFVKKSGGIFSSAEQYVKTYHTSIPRQFGTWIDLSLGIHDPSQILRDIKHMKLTEVFLMAVDPEGNEYFTQEINESGDTVDLFGEILGILKREGIRVHAWIPVFRNSRILQSHPEWAMVAQDGTRSSDWVSPTNPEAKEYILKKMMYLVKKYDIDGIHLDYVRYPDVIYDFTQHAQESFKVAYALEKKTDVGTIVSQFHNQWMNWRIEQIVHFVRSVREELHRLAGPDTVLSAALIGEAAQSYRAVEKFGQDYSQLARYLDIVIPMAYFKEDYKPIEWISNVLFASKVKVGVTPLFAGISAYQKQGGWDYNVSEFDEALKMASSDSDGIVLYPYLYLFRRGDPAWNMPEGSLTLLRNLISHTANQQSDSIFRFFGMEWRGVQTALLIPGLLITVALIMKRRRRYSGKKSQETMGQPPQSLQSDGALLGEWRAIDEEIRSGTVDGAMCEKVSSMLRAFNAKKIERFRIAYILDILSTSSDPLSSFLNGAFKFIPGWRTLGFRFLEEAALLGYSHVDDKTASITDEGRKELMSAREAGYDRDLWMFIERRLHESLGVTCPLCEKSNVTNWYWDTFDCSYCGKKVFLQQCARVTVKPPQIAARFYQSH